MGSQSDKKPDPAAEGLFGRLGAAPPSRSVAHTGEPAQLLSQAVAQEIIPRLVRAHAGAVKAQAAAPAAPVIGQTEVLELARLIVHEDDAALHAAVAALRQRGVSVQAIFLDLLAPTARHLGQLWECDVCDFTEVTVAMGRLQQLLRANSASFGLNNIREASQPERRVLLLPCPGEQHTFGLSLVAEFFYRAGWDVSSSFIQPTGSLSALVERQWFDVIGFSLGSEARLRLLDESIRQARRASMNPHVHIIAGGSIFCLQPELSERISADAVILDASQAPELATRALARLKTES
jgi:methanogenic corrinoid protein MtbC1